MPTLEINATRPGRTPQADHDASNAMTASVIIGNSSLAIPPSAACHPGSMVVQSEKTVVSRSGKRPLILENALHLSLN
jgi:hypothetical protein